MGSSAQKQRYKLTICKGGLSMIWTTQELIQLIKDDLGIHDLPKVASDKELLNRFKNSCLKEFSLIYPILETFNMGRDDLVDPTEAFRSKIPGVRYQIPKFVTMQMNILSILKIEPLRSNGYTDLMWPYGVGFAPDQVISTVSSIKAAAATGMNMVNSLTFEYDPLRKWITLYHGWSTGSYKVRCSVEHDPSLSTVPDTAMSTLRELAMYDIGEYIYNSLKRKNNLDTGIGNITLNIDDFQDFGSKKREMIKELSEDANLDFEEIEYF
jgi:hypothetical protein